LKTPKSWGYNPTRTLVPFPITEKEKTILIVIALLLVLGLIGLAVL
jgi:hypothetical protein